MTTGGEDNSHAGQGPVLLDIGGSVGALVVTTPAGLIGRELEITRAGERETPRRHVAVIARPRDGGAGDPVPCAVFGDLEEGAYELHVKPDGPVRLVATVTGGAVEFAAWPGDQPNAAK